VWLDKYLAPNWRQAHKFRSVQVAAFWAGISGAYTALPAFQNVLPPVWFALTCVIMSIVICVARLEGQPGLDK
jgi:hypothetical protein